MTWPDFCLLRRVPDIESYDYRRFAVLIVDPDPEARTAFRRVFGEKFWILEAENDTEALGLFRRQTDGVGVLVRDEKLTTADVDAGALEQILSLYPNTIRILSTEKSESAGTVAKENGSEISAGDVASSSAEISEPVSGKAEESGGSVASDQETGRDGVLFVSEEWDDAHLEAMLSQGELPNTIRVVPSGPAADLEGEASDAESEPAAPSGRKAGDRKRSSRVFYISKPWDMEQMEVLLSRAMELFVIRFERDLLLAAQSQGVPAPLPTMPLGGGVPAPYPTIPLAFGPGAEGLAAYLPTIMSMPGGFQLPGQAAEAGKPAKESKPGAKRPSARRPGKKGSAPIAHSPSPVPSPVEPVAKPKLTLRKPRVAVWKKLGGGSLSVSLIIHGVLLAIGVLWIFQIIPEKKPQVDFIPKNDGGSPVGVKSRVQQRKISLASRNLPRAAAKDVATGITLPEPSLGMTAMTSIGKLGGGMLGGGMMGGGAGPRAGAPVFNAGMNANLAPSSPNPFGVLDPGAGALVGTLYDLKQDRNRKPTSLGGPLDGFNGRIATETMEVLNEFTRRGWNEQSLASKYFQAPQQLYQTKVFMPSMDAAEAPKAFNCEKDVQPSRWVVIYRGMVRPPKSGKYRFVGAGDDVLAVRFGGKTVFDYGYASATAKLRILGNVERMKNEKDREWNHERKNWTMPEPVSLYPYSSLAPRLQQEVGGLAAGLEFEADANKDYPIEILISEIPGGVFCAYLMIEEIGAKYERNGDSLPILPMFRLDQSEPAVTQPGPPYDPKAPAWKLVPGRGKLAI